MNRYPDECIQELADCSDLLYSYFTANSIYTILYTTHRTFHPMSLLMLVFPCLGKPSLLLSTNRNLLFFTNLWHPLLPGRFSLLCVFQHHDYNVLHYQFIWCCKLLLLLLFIFYLPHNKVSVSTIMLGILCLKIFSLQNECLLSPPRARR